MINIAKLLKDAPKGMKLYSPLLGEVEFAEVMDTGYMPIRVMKRGYGLRFDEYGRYMGNEYPDSECILFPSKDCRTWEEWVVKPKFEVGDWVVSNKDSRTRGRITSVVHGKKYPSFYGYHHTGGYFTSDLEDNYRLWTLEDAKDGDVLAFDWTQDDGASHWEKIVIFKKYHPKGVKGLVNCPCVEGYGNTFKNGKLVLQEEVPYYSKTWTMTLQPATIEQRDLLFSKMREAGCQWDEKKKEVKKIQAHHDHQESEPPVEPTFKVGDWVVTDYGKVSQVVSVDNAGDGYTLDDGVYFSGSWCDMYHLWTIADAKDGDVLSSIRGCPFIYDKYRNQRNNLLYYYAGIDGNGDFVMKCPKKMLYHFGPSTDAVPATKEQRDLLLAKMREAGYLWDAEKKELRKIFEPQFKVGDDIKTGNTIDTIAEIDYATRSYLCKSGRTIWFENQDLWHLVPKPHYGIANFHEGMPVLVRNGDCLEWEYVTFSHYRKVGTPFCAGGQYWYQCIPFSEETKHLLGTTGMPDERFINW
jgi:hypothetical protein